MKQLIYFSRLFIGVLFIISGLIKANDPTGFSYKLDEYFEVLSIPFFIPYSVFLASLFCVLEVGLGVMLLQGYKAKYNIIALLLLMGFFLFLTFYSAYFDKVKDCGCFGDALKLTPWQSFAKDVVLMIFIIILWFGKNHIRPKKKARLQTIIGFVVPSLFALYCYAYLPVIDFLPYAKGKDILMQSAIPENAPKDSVVLDFIYTRDGKEYHFDINNLPADLDKYKYKYRKDVVVRKGYEPPIHDFKIFHLSGSESTDLFLHQPGFKILLVYSDLSKANSSVQQKINELVTHINAPNKSRINVWAFTASSTEIIDQFTRAYSIPFTFYRADATMLKTIIRSNPGILLLNNNLVLHKWPALSVPDAETVREMAEENEEENREG